MSNKLIFAILLICVGLGFLWFGLKSPTVSPPTQNVVDNIPVATISATYGVEGEIALVTEVVDGDTIKIEGHAIRLIGIDTPETKDPRKSVQCFGKEASNKLKELVEGKVVILQKDVSEVDKYKRLLRYILLPLDNGSLLFVNDYMIREGYARALTYPPDVKYTEQFLETQKQAKAESRGLWGYCL